MLTQFGVICLWTQDFPKMLAYYRDTLGLPTSSNHPGGDYQPGVDWAKFELQGTVLELFAPSRSPNPVPRAPYPRENATVLCFLVDDFEAERNALEARGVTFYLEDEEAWGRYAHFRDPEGNDLQIYQPNSGD